MKSLLRLVVALVAVTHTVACEDEDTNDGLSLSNSRTAGPYRPYTSETYLAGPKDICVVTQYTSNMDVFATVSSDNHQAYAWRHGYNAIAYRGRISGDAFRDPQHPERLRREGLYWQKLTALEQALSKRGPDGITPLCNWVMWMDADAVFTNVYRPIEEVLAPYADKDIVLSREYKDSLINAGVFFVRNTDAGRAFINGVSSMYEAYKNRNLPEQEAMQDFAFNTSVPTARHGLYEEMEPRLRREVGVATQRTFNSFAIAGDAYCEISSWQPCDFVAHIATTPAVIRAATMRAMNAGLENCAP